MDSVQKFPTVIDVRSYDNGFVVRMDDVQTFYPQFEDLCRAIYPSVRHELSDDGPCAGTC